MKKRKMAVYETADKVFYIFCEGTKTEPNYFEGFKKAIEQNPIYKNRVFVTVFGTGMNTMKVLEKAENFVKDNNIQSGEVWCIYDKDDFPSEHFNRVPERIESINSNSRDAILYNALAG